MRIRTFSEEETERLGNLIASCLKGDEVIFLIGDLGTGKTVLAKGIAKGLGVKVNLRSSSFILISRYEGETTALYHVDLYRLEGEGLFELGLEELIGEGVIVIEWADRLKGILNYSMNIKIEILGDDERIIELDGRKDLLECVKGAIEKDAYFNDRHLLF